MRASSGEDDIGDTAVFFDYENIVLGLEDKFQPKLILEELSGRGNVLIRRAYADWGRFARSQGSLLELGVEMVFLPTYGVRDKNRTDTAVCIDAMEILFMRPNIETFVIVSGDSDFGVLARRLRSYGKRVVGISAKTSASKILAAVCHEFIFYESLVGKPLSGFATEDGEKLLRHVLPAIAADRTTFQPSFLKDRMRKMDSTFSERNFGHVSFLKFIEAYPHLLEVRRFDRGRTEVTILDEPRARRARPERRPAEPRQRAAPRSADQPAPPRRTERAAPAAQVQKTAPPVVRTAAPVEPGAAALAAKDKARGQAIAALRTLLKAFVTEEEMTLNKVRGRIMDQVPTFDPKKLGYKTFTEFLGEQPDVVEVIRQGRRVRIKKAS